ncbi:MAG: oxaloacetate decarboxylase [Tannerella sp.]|jgi:oxaloacetate decarboxylase gamma subunit|nr:oxaloacetate decarboxylase [Tannerella sp.]
MENLGLGFLLLLVGISTVYIILLIVIGLGKLLILLVNRYWPDQSSSPGKTPLSSPSDIPDPVVVAIVSAVSIATEGKGRVTSIGK